MLLVTWWSHNSHMIVWWSHNIEVHMVGSFGPLSYIMIMHFYHQMWRLIYFKLTAELSATSPFLQFWRQFNFGSWWLNSLPSRHPYHLHRSLSDWEGEGLQGPQVQVLRWEESKKGETSNTVKLSSFIELVAFCATSNLALFPSSLNVRNYKGRRARLATCTATGKMSDNEISNVYA